MSVNADSIPRYAEPTWDELSAQEPTCGDCAYYREVTQVQGANKFVHCIGVCIFDVFQANTFKELAKADLVEVDPTDEPCRDYKEDK